MAVLTAPVEESAAILHIALGRIDLALLTILGHAVPFEMARGRVYRPSADKLPSAGGSALRVKLHPPSLPRHAPRPGAHAAPVPAPRAPILQLQRRCGAPAPRIEPAASLSGPTRPIGVAARPAYGLMDLPAEARRATAHPADPVHTPPPTTAITNPPRTDAEDLFLACLETTIGWRN